MLKEHKVNLLNNFIMGWYIDHNTCDQLIDIHKTSKFQHQGAFGESQEKLRFDKGIKDSTDVPLSPDSIPQGYVDKLFMCAKMYMDKYRYCDLGEFGLYENSQIQHYPPGGGYKEWHMEKGGVSWPIVTRHLVFMTYLNDINDGGGTEFLYQGLTTKAEKGLTLIWPPEWTFTHRSQISPTQEKYIITGWLNLKTYPLKGNENA